MQSKDRVRADSFYAVGMTAGSGRYCKVPGRRGEKSMVGVSLRLAVLTLPETGSDERELKCTATRILTGLRIMSGGDAEDGEYCAGDDCTLRTELDS